MQRGLRGLDELTVGVTPAGTSTNVGAALRGAVLVDTEGASTPAWMAGRALVTELSWRLAPCDLRLYTVGPSPEMLGWVGEDLIEDFGIFTEQRAGDLAADLDVLVSLAGDDGPRLVAGGDEEMTVVLPWSPPTGSTLDRLALLTFAPRTLARASVLAANPLRSRAAYIAVSIDSGAELGSILAGEVARLASAERWDVVLVRDAAAPASHRLEAARAALAGHGVDVETLVDSLDADQYVGLLAGARLVVTADAEIAALARAYNPNVALMEPTISLDHEIQRRLRAATAGINRHAVTAGAERTLDAFAEHLDGLVGERRGRTVDPEVGRRLLEARLRQSEAARESLSQRLLSERSRFASVNRARLARIHEAEAERDEAKDASAASDSFRRRQALHLNQLELRVAELDQGVVRPPVPSRRVRLVFAVERRALSLARRVRWRLIGR